MEIRWCSESDTRVEINDIAKPIDPLFLSESKIVHNFKVYERNLGTRG